MLICHYADVINSHWLYYCHYCHCIDATPLIIGWPHAITHITDTLMSRHYHYRLITHWPLIMLLSSPCIGHYKIRFAYRILGSFQLIAPQLTDARYWRFSVSFFCQDWWLLLHYASWYTAGWYCFRLAAGYWLFTITAIDTSYYAITPLLITDVAITPFAIGRHWPILITPQRPLRCGWWRPLPFLRWSVIAAGHWLADIIDTPLRHTITPFDIGHWYSFRRFSLIARCIFFWYCQYCQLSIIAFLLFIFHIAIDAVYLLLPLRYFHCNIGHCHISAIIDTILFLHWCCMMYWYCQLLTPAGWEALNYFSLLLPGHYFRCW